MSIADAVRALRERAAGWALSRCLAANSVTGISLLLGLCAAAWFTAGTRADDVGGALVLCCSYLAGRAARQLSLSPGAAPGQPESGAGQQSGRALLAVRAAGASQGQLARVSSAAAEYAVYAALAVGGDAAGLSGMWVLAVTVMILAAIRQTVSDCHDAAAGNSGRPGGLRHIGSGLPTMPAGGRVLLVAVAAPALGPRTALLGLLVWAIIAAGYAIGGYRPGDPARAESVGEAGGVAESPGPGRGVPGRAVDLRLATITACRDDGRFACYLGRLVRGSLIPLPAALTGLAAASMLAVLGLRDLPGIIVLTPLVVMLLAAPGSSHPHDGRFDWLVPAVLQAGQYVYIATLGFASGAAPSVTFALCAMTAVRYADLGYRGRHAQTAAPPDGRRTRSLDFGLGWEGRMLVAGLGAIAGITTVAYLALTAYLGVLICSRILASCLAIGEEVRP